MGSDDFARVNSKLGFMFESYLRSKNLLVRLYSIVRNAQYIWENKLERGQTQFKNFENMLNGSRFLEATPMPISENSVIVGRGPNNRSRHANELPKKYLVRLKEEEKPMNSEEVEEMFKTHYDLTKDYILIKEIISNRLIMNFSSLEEITNIIKKEIAKFRRAGLSYVSRMFYLNQQSSEIYAIIYKSALTNLLQKFYRLFKEIENLLKELLFFLYLVSDSQSQTTHTKRQEPHFFEKYPKVQSYNFDSQKKFLGKLIKPYSQVIDNMLSLEKPKKSGTKQDQDANYNIGDEEDLQKEKSLDLEFVKKMIDYQKSRRFHKIVNQIGNKTSKSEVKREQNNMNQSQNLKSKKIFSQNEFLKISDTSNNQRKEIMDFGTTLRSMKAVLDQQAIESVGSMKSATILDAKIKDRTIVSKMRAMMLTLQGQNAHVMRSKHDQIVAAENTVNDQNPNNTVKKNQIMLRFPDKASQRSSDPDTRFNNSMAPNNRSRMDEKTQQVALEKRNIYYNLDTLKVFYPRSSSKKKVVFNMQFQSPESLENTTMKRTNGDQPTSPITAFKIRSTTRQNFTPRSDTSYLANTPRSLEPIKGSSALNTSRSSSPRFQQNSLSSQKINTKEFFKRNGLFKKDARLVIKRKKIELAKRVETDLDSYILAPF